MKNSMKFQENLFISFKFLESFARNANHKVFIFTIKSTHIPVFNKILQKYFKKKMRQQTKKMKWISFDTNLLLNGMTNVNSIRFASWASEDKSVKGRLF